MIEQNVLTKSYFTREFPGEEVELKLNLKTLDPSGFIFKTSDGLSNRQLHPFLRASRWGSRSTETRMLEFITYMYGYRSESGELTEAIAIAQFPKTDVLAIKVKSDTTFLTEQNLITQYSLRVRKEVKSSFVRSRKTVNEIVQGMAGVPGKKIVYVGSYLRERWGILVHNSTSMRNFSLVADRSTKIIEGNSERKGILSQVEIEYKGRDGITFPDKHAALLETYEFARKLIDLYGSEKISLEAITKFEWLIRESRS